MDFKSKSIITIMIAMALGLPMLIKGPDGRPIMSLDDWLPNTDNWTVNTDVMTDTLGLVSQDAGSTIENAPDTLSSGSGKMYQWQDNKGQWHFSTEKPLGSKQASIEDIPDAENVMETSNQNDNKSTITFPGGLKFGGG